MRVFVTGGGGQLGRELALQTVADVVTATREQCDVTSTAAIAASLDSVRPDVVINCAAWTKVDAAEAEVEAAFRINAMAPRLLAAATASRDLPLIHISTDFVFDGSATEPIHEWAVPLPASAYGRSKLAGEHEVRTLNPRHQIVRTSWLYGQEGPNFVLTMLRRAAAGPLRVVGDQWGSPTWTGHLAPALLRLAELGIPGTYHLTGGGVTTWHGLAVRTLAEAGQTAKVTAITTDKYPTPALRPKYSVLANQAWHLLGESPLPPWEDGLTAYLARR